MKSNESHQRKIQSITYNTCAGELIECTQNDWDKVLTHVNIKRIQSLQFQEDLQNPEARVLQIDFAVSYSCEYQNEIQSALWSRESVTLFTAAMTCKTFLIVSESRDKGKDTVAVFIDFLYNHFGATDAMEDITWSDGPTSEFKNKYMVKFLQSLSQKHNQQFSWKYVATSHGKGIVDGVGGRAKSLVCSKVMSQGDDRIEVQSSWDFVNAAQKLLHKTEVFHISQEEIIVKLPDLVD